MPEEPTPSPAPLSQPDQPVADSVQEPAQAPQQVSPADKKPTKPPMHWRKKLQIQSGMWAVGALVVMGLSIGIVIIPSQTRLKTKQQEIQKEFSIMAEQNAATKNLITAHRRYDEMTETIHTLDAFFINRNNPLLMIDRIEELAEEQGLTITVTLPAIDDTGKEFILPVELVLSLDGELNSILNFIHAVMQEPFFVDMNNVIINQQTDENNTTFIHSNITIMTFWK